MVRARGFTLLDRKGAGPGRKVRGFTLLASKDGGPGRSHSGFTLLEVLVALAIFSVAALAVLSAANNNITSLGYLEEKTFADWVANNKLVDADLGEVKDGLKGTETLAGVEWHWQYKRLKTEDANFYAVEVRVGRTADLKAPLAVLRRYQEKQP
ncbi:type II secretion system minor pseudopilin GspI [Gallaecimonas sp. GXIMD4217]|uniref:type II secretion system minor pseudopilin GspI n=1 Tax=Gallaecimonas sp. GXIMD4217 TaxID=3131927 RepID=UPI00311AE6AA